MHAVFPALSPQTYRPHDLHAAERNWPETNCYVDLWIELISTAGFDPHAMLAVTLMQDFEGDQFTFFKIPVEDIESLYGIVVTELAIFDRVEDHVLTQIERGRLCLVEMDSFYLPDTQGVSYRLEHGKTTVGFNRLDLHGRRADYFHNGGFFHLEGEDFDGLFQRDNKAGDLPFLPYTEFVKFPADAAKDTDLRPAARALLARHFARRPAANPIRAFVEVYPLQAEALAARPFAAFHKYAFNTLRQLGANFELCASHLRWYGDPALEALAGEAQLIAETAKASQFQLARAVTRKKFDTLAASLAPAADAWDRLMEGLGRVSG